MVSLAVRASGLCLGASRPVAPRILGRLGAVIAFVGVAVVRADVLADDGAVVVRVGNASITAAELRREMAAAPPFQLRALGSTPDAIRRAFLNKTLVRDLLLAKGSEARGVAARPEVRQLVDGALRRGITERTRVAVERAGVTDGEVRAFYDQNAPRFHVPQRTELWRIVVGTRDQAIAVIAEMKKDATPHHWQDLARERSIDKVTSMRGGKLGFVGGDGSTTEPGFAVSRAVVEAAARATDGELLQEPVQDGDTWAVVWRRQTTSAIHRSLEDEAPSIRQILIHERTVREVRSLVAALRRSRLQDYAPEVLDSVDLAPSGDFTERPRPGTRPHSALSANPVPVPGPDGLR